MKIWRNAASQFCPPVTITHRHIASRVLRMITRLKRCNLTHLGEQEIFWFMETGDLLFDILSCRR